MGTKISDPPFGVVLTFYGHFFIILKVPLLGLL